MTYTICSYKMSSCRISSFNEFEVKAKAEFDQAIQEIDEEIDSRLKHQDNILKDLKFFVEKFGETMKIIGSDV